MSQRRARDIRRPTRLGLLALLLLITPGCQALENIVRSISDGAPCAQDSNCLGGTCLLDLPGGYCTTLQCETQGCSNIFGADCLALNQVGGAQPLCFASCELDTDCRDGYGCVDDDGAHVCLPDNIADNLPQAGENGTSCSRDTDCLGGTCMLNFTGGYCTRMNCADDAECANFGDGQCLALADDTSVTACFDGCSNDSDCRFDYACRAQGDGGVCDLVDDSSPVRNPNGADDGETCVVDINCKGGTCLRAAEGYPDGYCTTLGCDRLGCNGDNTICQSLENDNACFVACTDNSQCRDGYECAAAGYCAPPRVTNVPGDPTGTLDVICESEPINGGRRISFNIDAGTESFGVVPFSQGDFEVRPVSLRLPNGAVGADFQGNYAFLDVNWELLVNIAPTFFPAAPQFASLTQQGGGLYSMDVATDDSQPCYYVIEKPGEGSRIALNLYFVGVPGVSAGSAPNDGNVQQMIDSFERIYNGAGIGLDTVRYFDITGDDADRFRIIRDFNEIFELLTRSQPPGNSLGELLSVNVFLIQDFAVPQAPGLLGLSSGIPGVPGLHGNHGSGLVFTSSPLGFDNDMLGQTMAHEVGHYNGLRHTTDHDLSSDPIEDTPVCSDPNNGASCPDATNLMFPFSLGGIDQTVLTNGQSQVLRWSPLVQ